jgi:hypothetical protein
MVAHNKLIPTGFASSGWTAALILGVVALGANGSSSTAATLTSALASSSSETIAVNAFDINASGAAIIPAPGTKQGVVSEGDELIVNDQLTVTSEKKGGYPIIGYASGTCTFTRVAPDGQGKSSPYNSDLQDCVVTAVLPKGSITGQGVVTGKPGADQPATLAVTSGTGSYEGAGGIVKVKFGREFDTFTFLLQ